MSVIFAFPSAAGPVEVDEPPETEAATIARLDGLLDRWEIVGEELKRRDVPIDLELTLEISDLLRVSR